jgi:hypothetical protein
MTLKVVCTVGTESNRIPISLPPPYTWTGTRSGQLRYRSLSLTSTPPIKLTLVQRQPFRFHLHLYPPHRPQTHPLPPPHLAPHISIPLFPRRPHRPLLRIHLQHNHPLGHRRIAFPTPSLLALHLHPHPALQRRQTRLLHAPARLHPRGPPLLRKPAQRCDRRDFRSRRYNK